MGEATTALEAETQALREAHAGLNRNDIPAFMRIFDPQIDWIEFAGSPGGGTYRGIDALRELVTKSRSSWAEGSCQPQRIIVSGNRIIQFVHVRVRLKDETEWREGDVVEVYTFRDGKVVQARLFSDEREAMEWADVKAD